MSKFRLELPKDMRAKPEERAALAFLVKASLGKKVYKVIKGDEDSLKMFYSIAVKLSKKPVYFLDFEEDYVFKPEEIDAAVAKIVSGAKLLYTLLRTWVPRFSELLKKALRWFR